MRKTLFLITTFISSITLFNCGTRDCTEDEIAAVAPILQVRVESIKTDFDAKAKAEKLTLLKKADEPCAKVDKLADNGNCMTTGSDKKELKWQDLKTSCEAINTKKTEVEGT